MASQYRRRSLMLNTIAKVAQGNPTIITDSSSRRLQKLNVYGQSSQDGTPSVENPIPIISKEVSEIKVTNGADLSQTITLTEPITLRGIPVSSGGNVTIDGQQYIADVITEKDGVIGVERNAESFSLLIKDMNNNDSYPGWKGVDIVEKILPPQANDTQIPTCLCTIQSRTIYGRRDFKSIYFTYNTLGKNQTELKEQYPDLSVNFIAINYQPTFEPLPEADQEAIRNLKTFYPNTVIQTGCWNEVTYSAKRGG